MLLAGAVLKYRLLERRAQATAAIPRAAAQRESFFRPYMFRIAVWILIVTALLMMQGAGPSPLLGA